jgi:hypothetical protein
MEKTPTTPRALNFSTRLYQILLLVYPAEFRREYSGPMLQVFRDCCRKALHENGLAGLLPLWGWVILDTVRTALEEYSQRGVEMSKEMFLKLCGWAMVMAAVIMPLSFLPEADQILDGLYQTFGRPATSALHGLFQTISAGVRSLIFPAAILFIILGLCRAVYPLCSADR